MPLNAKSAEVFCNHGRLAGLLIEVEKLLPTQAYPINPPRPWPISSTPNTKSKMNMTVALLTTNHTFQLLSVFSADCPANK
jgi:hypothetical protein